MFKRLLAVSLLSLSFACAVQAGGEPSTEPCLYVVFCSPQENGLSDQETRAALSAPQETIQFEGQFYKLFFLTEKVLACRLQQSGGEKAFVMAHSENLDSGIYIGHQPGKKGFVVLSDLLALHAEN